MAKPGFKVNATACLAGRHDESVTLDTESLQSANDQPSAIHRDVMKDSKRLALWLPLELEKRLIDFAATTGRTKSAVVREAIVERIGDLEKAYLPRKANGKVGKKAQRGSIA